MTTDQNHQETEGEELGCGGRTGRRSGVALARSEQHGRRRRKHRSRDSGTTMGVLLLGSLSLLLTSSALYDAPTAAAWIVLTVSPTRTVTTQRSSPFCFERRRISSRLWDSCFTSTAAALPVNATDADPDLPPATRPERNATDDEKLFPERSYPNNNNNNNNGVAQQHHQEHHTTIASMTTMSSLGDIMGPPANHHPNSNKKDTLASRYGITHPLDRMALTANGNLQRLVASYYDAPVTVVVESCTLRGQQPPQLARSPSSSPSPSSLNQRSAAQPPPQIWDRVVHLQVFGRTFCTATSVIAVRDALCQTLVRSGAVGLGQLFRHLDLLPEFELRAAAPKNSGGGGGGGFWREYTLRCTELTCHIVEDFCPDVWEMEPKP